MSVAQALLSPASLLMPDCPAPARVAAVQTQNKKQSIE